MPSAAQLSDFGIQLNNAGRRREAFAAYEQALALEPTHGLAYNNLAVALHQHGDVDGSARAYAAALRHAPNLPITVPLNMMRVHANGARWRDWTLLEWLARRRVDNASWPWARLEARAFLVDDVPLLHAAADAEAAGVEAAVSIARWSCDADCEPPSFFGRPRLTIL